MAVHAQFGGLVLPPYYAAAEEQQTLRALKDYDALLSAAAAAATPGGDGCGYAWQQYDDYCAGQSELTCNNNGGIGGTAVMPVPSRKRGREDDELLHYAPPFLLPPGMRRPHADFSTTALASTSGRCAEAVLAPVAEHGALASELLHDAAVEVDALVRAECERLRAGLEAARQRQRRALVRAVAASSSSGQLARRAREAETRLDAARRRAAELEERVRLAAAEAQAWCGVARGNEAVAAGLRATLDALLLRFVAEEGFGESWASAEPVVDDAQSCCCVVVADRAAAAWDDAPAASSPAAKWACRGCGDGEASVLVLPCRHLCLCKACEPRTDACPVCSGDKNAALHIAPCN